MTSDSATLELLEFDSQEQAAIASAVAEVCSWFSEKKLKSIDDIEAHVDAIKRKNIELSSELSIAREQLDKVNLEAVVLKNDIDALNLVAA